MSGVTVYLKNPHGHAPSNGPASPETHIKQPFEVCTCVWESICLNMCLCVYRLERPWEGLFNNLWNVKCHTSHTFTDVFDWDSYFNIIKIVQYRWIWIHLHIGWRWFQSAPHHRKQHPKNYNRNGTSSKDNGNTVVHSTSKQTKSSYRISGY